MTSRPSLTRCGAYVAASSDIRICSSGLHTVQLHACLFWTGTPHVSAASQLVMACSMLCQSASTSVSVCALHVAARSNSIVMDMQALLRCMVPGAGLPHCLPVCLVPSQASCTPSCDLQQVKAILFVFCKYVGSSKRLHTINSDMPFVHLLWLCVCVWMA